MELQWRAADADVRPLVWGFVERRYSGLEGVSCQFPVAYPVMQVMLDGGCHVSLLEETEAVPRGSLWGGTSEMCTAAPRGGSHSFVAALSFEGAALLLGGPPRLAAGRILDMESLRPCTSSALVARLIDADSFDRRVRLVQDLFRTLAWSAGLRGSDAGLLRLCTGIATDLHRGSVGGIANAAGLSVRTLYNRFRDEIGCGPKRLLRLARLHRLLRTLHPSPIGGRPRRDPMLEFADQAHMHREFVALTGLRPREFVSAKARSGDQLFHSVEVDTFA